MSKIIPLQIQWKDTFPISQATINTGWIPGQAFAYDSTGQYAQLATGDDTIAIAMDPTNSLSSPPSGSLLTGFYGSGSKFIIDHSAEVAAASATRAYETDVLSASENANLFISGNAKWTTVGTGSVKGKLFQIPTSTNSYSVGIILRF
jgi:hypothetical protein